MREIVRDDATRSKKVLIDARAGSNLAVARQHAMSNS
jgi:hypothetical protein